jgi:phage terminase small subunit
MNGTYYKTGDMRRLSPAYSVRKESEKVIFTLSDRYGLSPKARDKFMKFDLKDEPDALDFI